MKPFTRLLRRQGFAPDFDTCAGGCRTWQWSLTEGPRTVIVQLSGDGRHRASHEHNGCSDTRPTDFTTFEAMRLAICFESMRTDSKYCRRVAA